LLTTNQGINVQGQAQVNQPKRVNRITVAPADGLGKSPVVNYQAITDLLNRLIATGYDFIKIENLYEINGVRSYSLGQRE